MHFGQQATVMQHLKIGIIKLLHFREPLHQFILYVLLIASKIQEKACMLLVYRKILLIQTFFCAQSQKRMVAAIQYIHTG